MTRTGKIFSWTFAILALLLAALILIIAFFDWNRIKPTINAKVSEELHRAFAINGNLAVICSASRKKAAGALGCRGRTWSPRI